MSWIDAIFKGLDFGITKIIEIRERKQERKEAKEKEKELAILKARARQKAKDAKESGAIYDIDPEKDYEVE